MIRVPVALLAFYIFAAAALTGCGNASVVGSSASISSVNRPTVTLSVDHASINAGTSATLTWTAAEAASCTASGGWTGSVGINGTQMVKPASTTTYDLNCVGGGITASASTTVTVTAAATVPPVTTPPAAGNAVARPDYNTGDGFFVLNGKLYDPDGLEFRIRGVNRNHYDSDSVAGLVKANVNAVRVFVTTQYGQTWPGLAAILQNDHVAHQEMPIPAIAGNTWGATTCSSNNAMLGDAVSDWVNNAKTWTALNRYMAVNIANEWGPSNSTAWRDQYIAAIAKMRAAGYLSPLVIDSGGCGQDMNDLLTYSTAVFNADPQKNIIFSFHLYGLTRTADLAPFLAKLNALQQSAGMVFVVGEFGPGRDIGPSPTLTTPGQVITAAESNDIGWMAWAWDDNDLVGCASDDNWFSMTYKCGHYTQASDLTIFGKDVVLNPTYGLQALAQKPHW
jgi:hypothetical protein